MKVNGSGGIDGSDALMGPKVQANDIKQAAEQFEAIFLRNMLKEMRKTNELFDSKDNPFNSDSVRMMQGFYDDEPLELAPNVLIPRIQNSEKLLPGSPLRVTAIMPGTRPPNMLLTDTAGA